MKRAFAVLWWISLTQRWASTAAVALDGARAVNDVRRPASDPFLGTATSVGTPVFQAYTGYPPCFRQPVLVLAGANILAFAEGRNNTYCSGTIDGYPKYINLRVSTDGQRWGPLQTLYEGNVDFLTALYDPAADLVHLMVQVNSSSVIYTRSTDRGDHWSTPVPLAFTTPFPGAIPGVGHGIVVQDGLCNPNGCGDMVGRLIMPFVCRSAVPPVTTKMACPGCYTCLLVSDDHGATWAIRAISNQEGSREAAPIQLKANGTRPRIYTTGRNMGNNTGHRWHAVSVDAGTTFTEFGVDWGIVDAVTANWTGVVAGGARFDGEDGAGRSISRILISTPLDRTARADLGLYVSTDEAATWNNGTLIVPGPAGYSDLTQLNATHVGILFENGQSEFAAQISFAAFRVS